MLNNKHSEHCCCSQNKMTRQTCFKELVPWCEWLDWSEENYLCLRPGIIHTNGKKIIRWQSFGFGSEQPKTLSFSTEQKKSDRCGFLKIVLKDKNHERWRSCWRSEEGHWHVSSELTISIFFNIAHSSFFSFRESVNHNFVLSPELSKYLLNLRRAA